jgi:hypothetical protein
MLHKHVLFCRYVTQLQKKIGNRKFLYLTRKVEHLAQTILQNDAIIWHDTHATYESQI